MNGDLTHSRASERAHEIAPVRRPHDAHLIVGPETAALVRNLLPQNMSLDNSDALRGKLSVKHANPQGTNGDVSY